MKMRPLIPILFAILFTTSFKGFAQSPQNEQQSHQKTDKKVFLIVDGTPIYNQEVTDEIMTRFGPELQRMEPMQRKMIRKQAQQMVVSDLVTKILLINEANRRDIKVDEAKVNAMFQKVINSSIKEEGADSAEQVLDSAGMSADSLKAEIRDKIKIENLLRNITAEVRTPSDQYVKQYFENNPEQFKKEEGTLEAFSEVKPQLTKWLFEKERQRKISTYLQGLQAKAKFKSL